MFDVQQPSLLTEKTALSSRFVPDKLVDREQQITEILRCLSPVLKKRKPLHLWLFGKPGTGKTATALHVLNRLEEKARIQGLLVNCWEKDTFYAVLDDIITQLRILRAEQQRTCFKLEKLSRHLGEKPFIIVLDEIDQLKPSERSATVYSLESLGNVGIICIANTQKPLFELEARVRSRLSPYVVHFPAYSCSELTKILAHRAQLALATNVWSKSILAEIARMAEGDARVAIRALKNTVELAEGDGQEKISGRLLRKQWNDAKAAKQANILTALTEDHRMLYNIVKQKREVLSGNLWQEYLRHCEQIERKPLALRTFSDYVDRLSRTGLITSERARVKGKVRLLKLCEP